MMFRLILLIFLAIVTYNVEGKAVRKRRNTDGDAGSTYSLVPQSNTQWATREHQPPEYSYWYKSYETDGNYHPYYAPNVKVDEYVGNNKANLHSNTNYHSLYASNAKVGEYAENKKANRHSNTNYHSHYASNSKVGEYAENKKANHHSNTNYHSHQASNTKVGEYAVNKEANHQTNTNYHSHYSSNSKLGEHSENRNDNHNSRRNYYSNYESNVKLGDDTERSNHNHHSKTNYDEKNLANLNQMFDSEYVLPDLKHESHEKKLNSKESDDPLESDQVFVHHEKKEKSKYIGNKVESKLSEKYSTVHLKGKEQSKTPSTGMNLPETATDYNKGEMELEESITQTEAQQLETEHPSGKLDTDSGDFGPIPSELFNDSDENLEINLYLSKEPRESTISETDLSVELDQRNLPAEKESGDSTFSEAEDSKATDAKLPVINDNIASSLQENHFSNQNNFDSVNNPEDKNLFKMGINQMFEEASFDSFVFNPGAQALEKFQDCKTPQNESGFCRYVQHCMLPGVLNSIQHFMENACIIRGRFIGVCCPDFPVQKVLVKWDDQPENFNDRNDTVDIPQDCGIGTNTRVVGGSDADRKAWLWMVALLNDKKKFFCGGSLINNRYVLTAAHCTFGTSKNHIVARLGEYDFTDPREDHDDYRVIEIKRHGQYNSRNLRNDIALLKLEKPVVFNEFVKTICFPEAAKDYIGDVATLVGWGHLNGAGGGTSDILQMASFPVINNENCSTSHRLPIPSSLICAAAVENDKGACNGDSGGPLMLLDENDRWKVIGIVSWGRRGCNPKFPTVYTRVTHYMDWIRKHST